MKIFYHKSHNNFGDIVSPWIIEKITGINAKWSNNLNKKHIVMVGSILQDCNKNSIVIGAGYGLSTQKYRSKPLIKMVRGKHTYSSIKPYHDDPSIVLGDPVSVISEIYNPVVDKEYDLGIIPHYIDYNLDHVNDYCQPNNVLKIDITDGIISFIHNVLKCKSIMSSSLHGLVLAHSYNIPALYVEFSDNVVGSGFKFRDYFSSMNIKNYKPYSFKSAITNFEIPVDTGNMNNKILPTLYKTLTSY